MRKAIAASMLLALVVLPCFAGIRSEGKYSGVVIFDRWGGCTLYSGVYVMYIAEAVKEELRKEFGKCVELDATEVYQSMNPGDGLIKKFKLLGPAPDAKKWESPEGLALSAKQGFSKESPATIVIEIRNISDKPRTVHMNGLAPTLLSKRTRLRDPSDGPSSAVITRQSFWVGDDPRMNVGNDTFGLKVTKPDVLKKDAELQPGEKLEISISLKLPTGEYDFLAGYGGGVHESQCIASNLVAFDVDKDGRFTAAKVAGR